MANPLRPSAAGPADPSRRRPARGALLAACLTACTGLAVAVALHRAADPASAAPARAYAFGQATSVSTSAFARQAAASWGGQVRASSGEVVDIMISDSYPEDPALLQRWADELVALVHGEEVSRVHVLLGTLAEVQDVCGREALACYTPVEETMLTPADDVPGGPSAAAILAHEYGHHVATNRDNTPWRAVDWGAKRWATAVGVCARANAGELFPGSGGRNYELNPGEGFAEAYRFLNERRLGRSETAWNVVSTALYPDDRALTALEQDVRQPWTGPTVRGAGGRFVRGGAKSRRVATPTPLDGTAVATLRAPRGTRFTLELLSRAGAVIRRASSTGGPASVRTTVCGNRSLGVRVRRDRGFGRYSLSISTP